MQCSFLNSDRTQALRIWSTVLTTEPPCKSLKVQNFHFSSLGSSMFFKFFTRNILPLKADNCDNRNKVNHSENTVDHPSTLLSEGDSHPWTMPPVNPKCSEKDSCNRMRRGSVGAGKGVPAPCLRAHPQQLQDHTEVLTTAFLPHRHAFP